MNLIDYQKNELEIIKYSNKNKILKILNIICNQGHSGFSIGFIIRAIRDKNFETKSDMLKEDFDEIKELVRELNKEDVDVLVKLLRYQPLSPLTLDDNEWTEYIDGHYQNKRLPGLFKDSKDDEPYYVGGVICVNQKGVSYGCSNVRIKGTNKYYRVGLLYPKQFDYFPTIKINVEEIETTKDDCEIYTTEEEINKIRKYYNLEYSE